MTPLDERKQTDMKKIFTFFLVLCLSIAAVTAFAEGDIHDYLDSHPEAAAYVSTWTANDGDWRIESVDEDGGIRVSVVHRLGDNREDIWEYSAAMGPNDTLLAVPLGLHYQRDTVSNEWTVTYYEDGDAEFIINEEGKLIWKDLKEDAGKDLAFIKIGTFYGGHWMKGDIEVIFYDWYEGQYDIRLYQRGSDKAILKDAILKGDYDAGTDTLSATGEFEGGEPFDITFSHDENGNVVWTENGESTVLEYSYLTD